MENVKVSEMVVHVSQEDAYRFSVSFEGKPYAPLTVDEPPPLGHDAGPNPARLMGAAIGNCLAASLLFCLSKHGVKVPSGIEARVTMDLVRTPEKRLRIGKVRVSLAHPPGVPVDALEACREVFEDFCTVTASVREGIDVEVDVGGTW